MSAAAPITIAELKAAYKRVGMWRTGKSFMAAIAWAPIRLCLEKSALAARQREHAPTQPRLI